MSARPPLNREEAVVLKEMLRLGDEATSDLLILRGRQLGWQHVSVRKALTGMQRKGYVRKGLGAGHEIIWRRVIRETVTHELAFGVVGDRYWATCDCGWRRWGSARSIAEQDEVRERAFQHYVRWPRRRWNQQGPADMIQTRLPRLGSYQ
jgi:hypothetical protein